MKLQSTLAGLCLTALLTVTALPTHAQSEPKTLRVVAHANLKILDPTFTTAYITRNFGYMVYDTLFSQDAKGVPQPQMVDKYKKSDDGKLWTFTLRPGLKFSDGTPVTSKDVVASLKRWTARDSIGRAMTTAGAEWKAAGADSFTLSLREPFGMVLEGLAKPSAFPPFILPERLAMLPTNAPMDEVLGSGPFIFKRDQWVPGNKLFFERNPHYVGRSEPPSGLAGNKRPHFDRVEWLYLPDSNSAAAALKNNEVDLIEILAPDFIEPLRADPNIKVGGTAPWQGFLVMNQLLPPFNNPKVRQAVLHAVNQEEFMAGMGYPADMRMKYCATWFICGSPNETSAGAAPFAKPDLEKSRQLLAEAGYKGEPVTILVPSDVTYTNAEGLIAAQMLRKIGMKVDVQTMDWASIGARRSKKDAPAQGGWNMYVTVAGTFDVDSPITNAYLSAACGNSLPGWPCDEKLDALRTQWVREVDPAKRRVLLDAFQTRAYEVVPYAFSGQFTPAFAARKELKHTDKLWGGLPTVWVLDK